jgi:hypothetical protein
MYPMFRATWGIREHGSHHRKSPFGRDTVGVMSLHSYDIDRTEHWDLEA